MHEMCGCVSFSIRASAQVYAPRSSWNVNTGTEGNGTANLSCLIPFSLSLFPPTLYRLLSHFPLSFSSSLYVLSHLDILSFHLPAGRSFWTETKERCASSCGCGLVRLKPLARNSGEQWKRPGAPTGQF